MDWRPIELQDRPHVGTPERSTGRVRLVFPLSEDPPREWSDYFQRAFGDRLSRRRGSRLDVPTPSVHPDGIHVLSRVSEKDAASWIKAVKEQIAEANTWYVDNVIAEQQRQEAAEGQAQQADQQTAEEMRRFVDSAWDSSD